MQNIYLFMIKIFIFFIYNVYINIYIYFNKYSPRLLTIQSRYHNSLFIIKYILYILKLVIYI